jgi:hypothetical protein
MPGRRKAKPYFSLRKASNFLRRRFAIAGGNEAAIFFKVDDAVAFHDLEEGIAVAFSGGARDTFRRIGVTRMWHLPEVAPDLVTLCAGARDNSQRAIPNSCIWTEYAGAHAAAAQDALLVEGSQTTRPALWAHFSELCP